MVIFGGLELVAAGYVVHEYNKNRKEKREQERIQQEEEDYRRAEEERRRRQRRRHSASGGEHRPRPSKQDDHKYGYKPSGGPSHGHYPAKPAAGVAGLYGASVPPPPTGGKYGYTGPSTSTLTVPAGPIRPNSALGIHRYDQRPAAGPPAYTPAYNPTPNTAYPHAPAPYTQHYPPQPPQQNNYNGHSYPQIVPPPPSNYQPTPYSSQYHPQTTQGPWAPDSKYPLPPIEPQNQDPRRRSDTSLPLGIYEEPASASHSNNYTVPPPSVHEMSAEGPWMHDGHRMSMQSPHVRFRLPGEGRVVGTGDRASIAVGSETPPPPAYRP